MVAIGRALMSNAGDPAARRALARALAAHGAGVVRNACARSREAGVGLLLVEQNAQESLRIADRGYVLENGVIVGHGTADQSEGRSRRPARLSRRRTASHRHVTIVTPLPEGESHVRNLASAREQGCPGRRTARRSTASNPVTGDVGKPRRGSPDRGCQARGRHRRCGLPGLVRNRPECPARDPAEGRGSPGVEGPAVHRTDGGRDRRDRRLGRLQRSPRRRHAARGGRP